MSHLYNPYSPESQDSSQGPYQPPSAQEGPGNVGEPSHLVPGSTHASYGASSGTSMNPSHIHPSTHPGPMCYNPGQSTTELENAIDIHIKQAREEASLQSTFKKLTPDHNTRQTTWPEVPLGLEQGQFSGYSKTSGASNWPSSYQTTSSEASYNVYTSTSSSPSAPNIPPSHYSQSSESYPGSRYSYVGGVNNGNSYKPSSAAESAPSTLWSGDYKPPDRPSSSMNTEYYQAGYNSESVIDIIKRFDLHEEDLEELCAYSEDELSPTNLPYLLRGIRHRRAERSSAAAQSSMVHMVSQLSSETMAGSRANIKCVEEAPPAFQQQSKVIEYGHTSKFTGGYWKEDEGRGLHSSSASSFSKSGLMDSYTSQSREPRDIQPTNPIPKRDSSADRVASTASPRPSPGPGTTIHRSAPDAGTTSHRPSPGAGTTSHRTSPGAGTTSHRPAPGAGTTSHRTSPGAGTTSHRTSPGAGTTSHRTSPGAGTTSHRPAPGAGTTSHRPAPGAGTTSHRPAPGAGTTSHRPAPGAGTTNQRPVPGDTDYRFPPGTNPGAVSCTKSIPLNQATSSDVSLQRPLPATKRMPTAAMISDYLGVTPKLFPHTCGLCNKPCVCLKDWLNHRNHIVHLASCRLLRRQIPATPCHYHLLPEFQARSPGSQPWRSWEKAHLDGKEDFGNAQVSVSTEEEVKVSTEKEVKVSTEKEVKVSTEKEVEVSTEEEVEVSTEEEVEVSTEEEVMVSTEEVVTVSTEEEVKVSTEEEVKVKVFLKKFTVPTSEAVHRER
ncbi:hypothetical protein NHX12_013903 [Muraenolepis orangiensis]|uniref:Uncharacterized protein n=1 Tax=Muraenolepis orangiensis TaxID=630683 RepID=A0A9Q0DEH1_9TELE|nr:hypothetical protein NHX12_013903 [Muraenolepis orangiensis]